MGDGIFLSVLSASSVVNFLVGGEGARSFSVTVLVADGGRWLESGEARALRWPLARLLTFGGLRRFVGGGSRRQRRLFFEDHQAHALTSTVLYSPACPTSFERPRNARDGHWPQRSCLGG
jgi:hypothetical protein